MYDHQFGFQKGKPTEHAALDLYANIRKAITRETQENMYSFSRFC